MAVDATDVDANGGRLLRATALSQNQTGVQVLHVESAQFLHGDCLVIEVTLFGWVVSCRNAT